MYAKSIDEVDTIIKHNNALFEAGVPIVPTLVDHPVVIEGVPAMVIPMAETGESVSPFIAGEMTRQLHHLSRNLDAINNYNHPYRDTRLVNSYRDNLSTHLDPSQLSTIEWLIEKVEKLAEDSCDTVVTIEPLLAIGVIAMQIGEDVTVLIFTHCGYSLVGCHSLPSIVAHTPLLCQPSTPVWVVDTVVS